MQTDYLDKAESDPTLEQYAVLKLWLGLGGRAAIDEVSRRLKVPPSDAYAPGDLSARGRPYETTVWKRQTAVSTNPESALVIQQALSPITNDVSAASELIEHFRATVQIVVVVTMFMQEDLVLAPAVVLEPELLAQLAQLHVELQFDLYVVPSGQDYSGDEVGPGAGRAGHDPGVGYYGRARGAERKS
ncbi:MAG TPA: DUF4279 domain-containing protein [Dermatophilaceae bacterium]|nr:DUF4279 domain-containing protein [Dermatophilaceae bacterium]